MTPVWNLLARLIVAAAFGPVDRTVCRFAEVTHRGMS